MVQTQRGFTLIELAVVMAIMAMIAAASVPSIVEEINERRAYATIQETQSIIDAARQYRAATGAWPGGGTCLTAITVLRGGTSPYLASGTTNTNKYNNSTSTSCTAHTFTVDQVLIADWDSVVANGLPGSTVLASNTVRTTIGTPGAEPALEAKLSRLATGNAELNRMRTQLLLGGYDISEVDQISAVSGSYSGNVRSQTLSVDANAIVGGNVRSQTLSVVANASVGGSANVSGNTRTQSLTVGQVATISGLLSAQAESQFYGKARFRDEVVLEKQVSEGQLGCTSGAIARDASGKTMSCQYGVWRGGGTEGESIKGSYQTFNHDWSGAYLSCRSANPYTGGCGCPTGYSARQTSWGWNPAGYNYVGGYLCVK